MTGAELSNRQAANSRLILLFVPQQQTTLEDSGAVGGSCPRATP